MKNKKLTCKTYICIGEKSLLWCEVSKEGTLKNFLSEKKSDLIKKKILCNIGENMSEYINLNLNSGFWGITNV